jgi:hypothetical protein
MAVPTITAVTPSSGSTIGRNVVRITGTDFRLPGAVVGYDPGPAQQTIKVTFGGVDATEAHAITATSGIAIVPAWTGPDTAATPYDVDVRVANLDDNGDEIAGENDTLSDGYSYQRALLTTETILQRVTKHLVKLLRRHVLPNTVITTSPMYDDSTSDDLDRIKQAQLPLVKVIGPTVTEDKTLTLQIETEEDDETYSDQYLLRHPAKIVDLGFTLQCWSDDRHQGAVFNMAQAVVREIYQTGYLTIDKDPNDSTKGTYSFPWEITDMPDFDMDDDLNGLRLATLSCEIREVPYETVDETIIERGYDVTADDVEIEVDNDVT